MEAASQPKKCRLNGALRKADGHCYLGAARVARGVQDRDRLIKVGREKGLDTFVFYTANWCPPCRYVKPLIIDASFSLRSNVQLLVVDSDSGFFSGVLAIPSMYRYQKNGESSEEVSLGDFFSYYGARDELGVRFFYSGDNFELGALWGIKTPLEMFGLSTQLRASVRLKDGEFQSGKVGAKLYLPALRHLWDVPVLGTLRAAADAGFSWGDQPSFESAYGLSIRLF